MTVKIFGALAFLSAVAAGTVLGAVHRQPPTDGLVLAADLHVHPFPGDGALTVPQLANEAKRRGLDVIAVTGHNNLVGWRLGLALGGERGGVILLPGQEVTSPGFHLIAVGISELVNWRLPIGELIAAIHAQGGAAIAAHPVKASWTPRDPATLALLDGAEIAHPARQQGSSEREEVDHLFALAAAVNARLSPVGSSDFHMTAPLGRGRTYLFVDNRTPGAVVQALRTGRTVAEDAAGRLFGPPELVARVPAEVRSRREAGRPSMAERASAAVALLGLALMCSGRPSTVKSPDVHNADCRDTP